MFRWLFALIIFSPACGGGDESSQQERLDRQSLVFDVGGRYIEDAVTGVPSRLEITNENGFHDIKALLEIPAGLKVVDHDRLTQILTISQPDMSESEKQGLIAKIELVLLNLEFGNGPTLSERGGENVPFDRVGDVSEIAFRKTVNESSGTSSISYQMVFDFYLTAYRSSQNLSFELTSFTDNLGKSSSQQKGLILTILRISTDSRVQKTKNMISEMGLTVSPFIKFQ